MVRRLATVCSLAATVLALTAAPVAAQGGDCPNASLRVGPSETLPDCRALELVSPPYKVGGVGVGFWYGGVGAVALAGFASHAAEHERFAVLGGLGSVLLDGAFAYGSDAATAERDPAQGWVHRSMLRHAAYGAQLYRTLAPVAATEDLSLVALRSNGGTLRPFPEMESWSGDADIGQPTFLHAWTTGGWELLAPTEPVGQRAGFGGDHAVGALQAAQDGSEVVAYGDIRGLAGAGDPTSTESAGVSGYVPGSSNAYVFDASGGLLDAFPPLGDPRKQLLGVCTGTIAGGDRTEIPERRPDGTLGVQQCPELPGEGQPGGPSAALVSPLGSGLGGNEAYRSISSDGSRVLFRTALDGPGACAAAVGPATSCPPQLYVRQRDAGGATVSRWVSRSRSAPVAGQPGAFAGPMIPDQSAGLLGAATSQGMAADGSRIVFHTRSPLTPDDPNAGCGGSPPPCTTGSASSSSGDLFLYEIAGGPDGDSSTPDGDPGEGTLTRISAGPDGSGDCDVSNQFGAVRFISDDASRIYFTCSDALAGVAAAPAAGAVNVILFDANETGGDRWRLVAELPSAASGPDACASRSVQAKGGALQGDKNNFVQFVASNCWRGTGDGRFVAFQTSGQLTGDDSDDAVDIYVYDIAGGGLTRISRAQGGAGGTYPCLDDGSPPACNADLGILGGPIPTLNVVSHPTTPGERVVFFHSRSPLTADDGDDVYDVYRWRADGTPEGELTLISGWEERSPLEAQYRGSFYVGNDADGKNVYVATREALTWQDRDAVLDVYTARVGGGFPEPAPPPVCAVLAGACAAGEQGAPVAGAGAPTGDDGGGDAEPAARVRIGLSRPSPAARRRAARRGVLVLRVRATAAGRVRAVARGRFGRRVRTVGRGGVHLRRAGRGTLRLRLRPAVRRRLRAGQGIVVIVRLTMPRAHARRAVIALKGDR